ncbi:MAG TPA: GntR family transcriptional regulator [Accumulibacter sp.]|uniref:GntR family transcriptional regulator n=3 Tax=Accumulibacter sp. TaxID=2053492 RepID=UPI002878E6AD|nr:GntR family transcriptional regulator [Accumulibacter sp.]MDS4055431.1 GntR family transcriptional regulator [Accumulibacter sp.]HMV05661.1 GntR family transcriptional regulator [Accumulibacter sp.]HMW64540.1 GntR family transcriptional regulator [Accumulibacter sp.]HMW80466.1 GntR family transcriptional regulator [Accumulibacter sp.]HNB66590.1 GntR family transcriptional regulator [Accumulibacter sp.]
MCPSRIAQTALYQEVAERLRQRIFAHELQPGVRIDEQALTIDYGISRTPLREALKVLAAEGLVTLKPRRGCFVTELSEQDLDEIFPLMAILEGRCALEATAKAQAREIASLEQIHRELEGFAETRQIERFFERNQEFHARIQDMAGNRWLRQTVRDLRKVLKLTRLLSLSIEGRLEQSLAEHEQILAAIKAGDGMLAQSLMHDHILSVRHALARSHVEVEANR